MPTSNSPSPPDPIGPALDALGASELLACVYEELRRLAHRRMKSESCGRTLQTTALVHEAWLRLHREGRATWENRRQFFAAASTAMRRVLVDQARARKRLKRGDAHAREHACLDQLVDRGTNELLDLDQALDDLRRFDARMARLVELRAFGGMNLEESAAALGVSARTARREWRAARLWLFERIRAAHTTAGSSRAS